MGRQEAGVAVRVGTESEVAVGVGVVREKARMSRWIDVSTGKEHDDDVHVND